MALLVVPMIEEFDLIIAFLVIIPNLKMKMMTNRQIWDCPIFRQTQTTCWEQK